MTTRKLSNRDALNSEKQFTIQELKEYNGKNGKPAYIAYKGKVYDVTDDYLWTDGEHQGEHSAGTDLTEKMPLALHMEDVLDRVKLIGTLKTQKP
jgi:predicted heme/steroid binding protein